MEVIYQPNWYELDQPLLVDYRNYYYLTKDRKYFLNGIVSDNDVEVLGEIKGIRHPTLGEILAFIPFGPTYRVITGDGSVLRVDAEDDHGEIADRGGEFIDWSFSVSMGEIQETGFTSKKRFSTSTKVQREIEKGKFLSAVSERYGVEASCS